MPKKSLGKSKKANRPEFLEGEFSLPKLEENVLKFWDERQIFEKSVETIGEKKKEFIFYEGPPTANGHPGIHHILARAFKDVIPRYKTMRGFNVPRKGGWDTHGLPVEIQVEKQLGLKSKKEIEQYGVAAFNKKCRESVWEFKDEWERMTKRMGFWLDLKNPYITYEPEYMETLWWIIAQFWKEKMLYKGHRVVQWCTRCGTGLSSHELAQGYKEVTDNSIYLKFKLKTTRGNIYIASWTTTPWTLPGNIALAINLKLSYVQARTWPVNGGALEYLIVAKERWPDIRTMLRNSGMYHKVDEDAENITIKDFIGTEYEPLFDVAVLRGEKSYRIYDADFVTATDGTGVVHTAVMYGEDDYALGKKLGLPEHHTVDEVGKFTKDVLGFAGMYVKAKETEEKIFEHLKQRGNFLRVEPYKHEYPHCWRCGTPILYYARTAWFVAMSKLRKQLIASNKTINWVPEHIRDGRFGEWLKEAKDWNFSRERYWGTPLPIWECKKCKHTEVATGIDDLNKLAGGSKNQYWVMRHGEAESNMFDVIDSGQRKFLKLTPRGRKQVEASIKKFEKMLEREHKHIDLMIASDVARTHETEKIDATVLTGEKVMVDKRLEEIHLGSTLTGYRDAKYAHEFPTYQARFEKTPEGGESLRDLRARMWKFLEDCESKYEGKNILLVTHEYPTWMLFHAAEGWSEKRAIAEKEAHGKDFIGFAEIRKLEVKTVSRNESGEVDLHKPYIDSIVLLCGKCGGEMRRVPEVADVWFDSGSMPWASQVSGIRYQALGGKEKEITTEESISKIAYPADYISEAVDQTRGWFYTLLAVATLLGYEAPYKNVICLGHINDKHGQKMSKSKGNIVDPWATMATYGVDAVRWYFYTATPPGEPKNFDEAELGKTLRRVHLIVYNSFVFWKTYAAKVSGIKYQVLGESKNILDVWILARLDELIAAVTKRLDHYEVREAALEIESFIDDLSRWYIRRSRRRLQLGQRSFSEGGRPESTKDYEAASSTLGYALLTLVKLMAPFTPFFSEGLYRALDGGKESVHLDEWPKTSDKGQVTRGKELIAQMKMVRELAALGLAKRADAGIKVRQPLQSITYHVSGVTNKELIQILKDEVNVKEVLFGKMTKPKKPHTLKISVSDSVKVSEGLMKVKLDTAITPALREEGLIREISRAVQELRQKAGLAPNDRVVLMLRVGDELRDAVMKNEATLKSDVGAKLIEYKQSEKFTAEIITKIEGQELWIGIRKI